MKSVNAIMLLLSVIALTGAIVAFSLSFTALIVYVFEALAK